MLGDIVRRFIESARLEAPPTTHDAEFWEEQWDRGLRNWQMMVVVIGVAAVVWWPLDFVILAEVPTAPPAYGIARIVTIIGCIVLLLIISRWPTRRRLVVTASLTGTTIVFVTWGYMLGTLGPPRELWFGLFVPAVWYPLVIALPFRARVGVTVWAALASAFGYFGLHPSYLREPFGLLVAGDYSFMVALSLIGGFFADRLRKQTFLLRRETSRQANELRSLNATLEERVREQTAELRQLTMHLESVRETERARISRELHDELGQELTALGLAVTVTRARFRQSPEVIETNLATVESLVQRTRTTTRQIVRDLRPPLLDELGLFAAIESLVQRTREHGGIACRVSLPAGNVQLPETVALAVFRILQESLTNVARHSQAKAVEVELSLADDRVHLRVVDDGIGWQPGTQSPGLGLVGLRERARALDGDLEIQTAPGRGTTIDAWVPIAVAPLAKSA